MRLARLFSALFVSALLVSCGGGGSEVAEQMPERLTAERLLAAPRPYADASYCQSSQPGYAEIEGRCQKLFDQIKPAATANEPGSPPRESASTPQAPLRALVNVSAADFFTWAQSAYPSLFGGTYFQDSIFMSGYGTFLYRYYPATWNYLGVLNGYAYVYGPVTGWTMYPVGALNAYSCEIYGCAPARTFITWTSNVNGVVVKDSGNEDFAFYSDTRCLYSYARQQETTNFCLYAGSANGSFAGLPVQVMAATNVNGYGCLAVLADTYGRQVDIYTDAYGIQTVRILSSYWETRGCTY